MAGDGSDSVDNLGRRSPAMLEPSRWKSEVDWEHMQVFRAKRLAVTGALALSLALGAGSAVVVATVDSAFAQESDTDLDGVVEAMPADGMVGTWQIGGKTVQVTETTRIDQEMGQFGVGVAVEVEGLTQPDGSIIASELEVADLR
jgi:hypothetical protein